MDSHLATVLISGSLEIQNGSRRAEGPEPVAEVSLDAQGRSSPCSAPGNLQPCPIQTAVAIRQDALSITGRKPEVGGTCEPASQEESRTGGFKQPMAAKPGVPVPCSRPIRLRCVVPPQRGRPITSSAICRTKDFPCSAFPSAGTLAEKNRNNHLISADGDEGERKENDESVAHESFHDAEPPGRRHPLNNKVSANDLDTSLISSHNSVKLLGLRGTKEETAERQTLETPPPQQELDFQPRKTSQGPMEEQTEPLDLSLPRRKERRCGRLLDDPGCEGLLIMEVDEYEGEGDRDVVEEDDEAVPHLDRLPPPASVLTSASATEEDSEDLLLIDDQGIPYTLTAGGLKVLQVDPPAAEEPRSEPVEEEEEEEGPRSPSSADPGLGPDSDLFAPAAEGGAPSPAPVAEVRLAPTTTTKAPEVFAIASSGPSAAAEPGFRAAPASASLGISAPAQPLQIFPSPTASAPLLFLSSSSSSSLLSSAPLGLTLPLTLSQSGSSTPMFLLLSSVPSSSSSGESTSTPIAVLDPSTVHLSKMDAASAPGPLPLPSGELSDCGSPLPAASRPFIRLTPSNPPAVVPGVNAVTSLFTSFPPPSPSPAPQREVQNGAAVLLHSDSNPSVPNVGSQAIVGGDAEEASHASEEPSSSAATPPHGRSPATEPPFDSGVHTQHLPLDDHLYFSNPAASPSPPAAPALSPGKLSPLDPLDPDSPSSGMGPRRVLYCQLCPRVFFYLSDLERHAITHSQKKPHVCQQCGKAFKRSSHLQVGSPSPLF